MSRAGSKEHKLDIFDVMAAIDRRDKGFLGRQDPDIKKGFAPPVALRWASAVQGRDAGHYIQCVNELVNVNFEATYEHPELQFALMAMCGTGARQRHQWIPMAKSGGKFSPKVYDFIGRFYPLASYAELDIVLSKHTRETFIDFLAQAGATPAETKELIDAYDKKSGKPKSKAKSKGKAKG